MPTNIGKFTSNDLGMVPILASTIIAILLAFIYDKTTNYGNGNAFGIACFISVISIYQSFPSRKILSVKLFLLLFILSNFFMSFIPFASDRHFTILAMPLVFVDYAIYVFGIAYVANKF